MFKKLSSTQKSTIKGILDSLLDLFGDGFITKNRIRYFIKENADLFFTCLEHGDKIKYNENCIVAIIGYSDNAPRKYLKILYKNIEDSKLPLQDIFKEVKEDIYVKVKKNNPIVEILKKESFIFLGNRGKEILFIKKYKGLR